MTDDDPASRHFYHGTGALAALRVSVERFQVDEFNRGRGQNMLVVSLLLAEQPIDHPTAAKMRHGTPAVIEHLLILTTHRLESLSQAR
jgi:hypothetical protein